MLHLALVWHHHQPSYRDPRTGKSVLPWVRLHATKDYWGMARLISEFPRVRATINIVPALADQLLRFAEGGARDEWLDVMEPEAVSLSEADRAKLIARGFCANERSMIAPFPRYLELFRRRQSGADFAVQDLVDLQVLANLAWMHRTLIESDSLVADLVRKGRDYSEEDKCALLRRQREIAGGVLPLHKRLEDAGQIELTTTPYYHPILPLLCDFHSAYEGLPWLTGNLGFEPISLRDDAIVQVERAVDLHRRVFGMSPRGMWPAEGSVSNDIVPILAARGIRYVATDEEILAQSLGRPIRRDGEGNAIDFELYRPWRVRVGGSEITVVFRDHRLSDLLGFEYQRRAGGASDFARRIAWIRDHAPGEALVTVVLDGENAWEHYPDGGVPFLRGFYRVLSELEGVEMVRLGDAVERVPALDVLPRLFPGSWIDHNFYVWIGHEEDRRGWKALLEARRALVAAERSGRLPRQALESAWESIYTAEGSDWYWWFGDDRSSGMDDVFDAIFRSHLQRVYELLGERVPTALEIPIKRALSERVSERPCGFVRATIDGRRTSFFEWHPAGRFRPEQEAGAMERAQTGALREVRYGFDAERFLLALDLGEEGLTIFRDGGTVHVMFLTPRPRELVVMGPGRMRLGDTELSSVAIDEILELAVPWQLLEASPGDDVRFFVELRRDGLPSERAPRGYALRVEAPSEDFEAREWGA